MESDSTAVATFTAQTQRRQTLLARPCFTGILFVLRSGIPWEMLPQELGCGSGMTCWRRLRDWQEAGIWQLIHFSLLDWLLRCGEIDWSRAVVDDSSIRIVTTRSKRSHWLMPSQACRESEDDRAIVLTAYWATVVMTLS